MNQRLTHESHISVSICGRYLVDIPDGKGPFPLLLGFHGYGQTAEDELDVLRGIAAGSGWCCCAPEALHQFYARGGRYGCSWMTSRNRQLRIGENLSYVNAVLEELHDRYPLDSTLVLHGFSQGTAMAVRTALLAERAPAAVMLCGGDVPAEYGALERLRRVHLARGRRDPLYTPERFSRDEARLTAAGVAGGTVVYDASHVCSGEYIDAASSFLRSIR
ncbi:phospholipase [Prosthecochloris sp. N3]|uniref:Phospholipase n=1 Tax=Prosthecochloris ethylica TaxID=2743976 RepID=A0ABR9XRA7_9CHLB|nr:phospholipase [Prosthecochloris ethylica]MBF0586355.1 phospholipase [Prosthecochloris ethylica]MBF0636427.1 phospholipase [Prosthecochloris ethylica]NUK47601.1 phospholipase [Prosthecochloris ethylica]